MRIAICDDDVKCIEDVKRHLEQYFKEHGMDLDLVTYNDPERLMHSDLDLDIVFLDIEMPEINGIELGRKLQSANKNLILIYITAYNHYLDDALDLGITRFFDKPINSERFYRGLDKAIEKLDNTELKIHLKDSSNGIATVKIQDIILVEIESRKTKVVTKDKIFHSGYSIKVMRDILNKSYFVSPHNSFIINTNYITYYCKDHVIMNEQHLVPIAYSKRAEFKKKLMMLMEE